MGLESPTEISISQDGLIFVADSLAQTIHVFNQSGEAQIGFNSLQCIIISGNPIHPIDVDVDKMFSLLNVESEKIRYKLIKSVKKRVTSVKDELNKNIDFTFFSQNLRKTFSELFNVEFTRQTLTKEESDLAMQICEKYSSEGWLYQR